MDVDVGSRFDFSFAGRPLSRRRVQMYGMFEGAWSIAQVCTQIAQHLVDRVGRVGVYSYNGGNFYEPGLYDHAGIDRSAPVGFFYGFPNEVPDLVFDHNVSVGGFVCEAPTIPTSWVDSCNRFDLIVVPSTFCARAFSASGVVAPIMVVPHGLEPGYRPVRGPREDGPFRFFNTFYESSTLARKGVPTLVEAFLDVFGVTGEEAVLVLRTQVSSQLAALRNRYDFGDAIRIQPMFPLAVEEYAAVLSHPDCLVHPSVAEGFGLVPLQALACETPVLATLAGGMVDYLDPTVSLCIEGVDDGGDDLRVALRQMVDDHDRYMLAAAAIGPSVRANHAWPVVLEEFTQTLDGLASRLRRRSMKRYLRDSPLFGQSTAAASRAVPGRQNQART
ncbi:MAG: glycosyltransferase family 4 protein [Actinomycetia bacterium]|nr:glycosyltransferase family 4 protein [Actinomycetes bacterium]